MVRSRLKLPIAPPEPSRYSARHGRRPVGHRSLRDLPSRYGPHLIENPSTLKNSDMASNKPSTTTMNWLYGGYAVMTALILVPALSRILQEKKK